MIRIILIGVLLAGAAACDSTYYSNSANSGHTSVRCYSGERCVFGSDTAAGVTIDNYITFVKWGDNDATIITNAVCIVDEVGRTAVLACDNGGAK